MKVLLIVITALITTIEARPNVVYPTNVVTVPPNCPAGQEWINGQCREVWFLIRNDYFVKEANAPAHYDGSANYQNTIVVPPNCGPGQALINGVCRDIWKSKETAPQNVVIVPENCPPGKVFVNGKCRIVWFANQEQSKVWSLLVNTLKSAEERSKRQAEEDDMIMNENINTKNIISVPNQCPVGYKPDALGICREIFS
ncbi:unnamed protein product [Chilo suppressalis]|uniref:Uncharacterized protein n=1 Tax=Chilo suppressalis TaxID=168631 RepID=A0ABN8BB56_CHISP|nr:unnamed protein product [Chilo suppressalis]